MRNWLNDSDSKPLKDIGEKDMLGKLVAETTIDPRLAHPAQPTGAERVSHVLTHWESKVGSGEDARICSNSGESGERILAAPVGEAGGFHIGFRARVGGVRLDAPALRAEARAVLVRLLVKFYVDRLNKVAA